MPAPRESADAHVIRSLLARVRRRLTMRDVWVGGGIGGAVAAAWLMAVRLAERLGAPSPMSRNLVAIAAGAVLAVALGAGLTVALGRRRRPVAEVLERRAASQNALVTAAELLDGRLRTSEAVAARVLQEAARAGAPLDPSRLFPLRGAGLWFATAVLACGIAVAREATPPIHEPIVTLNDVMITSINVIVTPPGYTGQPAVLLRDPPQVRALAGSTIDVALRGRAGAVALETIRGTAMLSASRESFTGRIVAEGDGFLAFEPRASDGTAGPRRLVGLVVTPDQNPTVRVTAPGRDVLLARVDRDLPVAAAASDDLGLGTLGLVYTTVSGRGENFTFASGRLDVTMTRSSATAWSGAATLPLTTMKLEPGDMVVYRALATDRRPGAAPVESDAAIVEIAAPGQTAAEGFAIDDQPDRYALSQRMVLVKTERLAARRTQMAPDAFALESRMLAAEQRLVRAEFVFMMGGELEEAEVLDALMLDEAAHAHNDADLAEGRLANQGRLEVTRAVRFMSEAATALDASSLDPALKAERQALEALQRAFTRSRYILRAMSGREQLDLTRRLTGTLDRIARDVRPRPLIPPNPRLVALRSLVARAAVLAGAPITADEALALAADVLRAGAGDADLRRAADALTTAATTAAKGDGPGAGGHAQDAVQILAAAVRAGLPSAAADPPTSERARLAGALADALQTPARSPARGPR